MARKIMTISLPPDFHSFVEGRVRSLGLGSTSEYFRSLIVQDHKKVQEEMRQQRRREEAERFGHPHAFRRENY